MAIEIVALYLKVGLGRLRPARRLDGAAGQAMVEYGIILAVVRVGVLLAATSLGADVALEGIDGGDAVALEARGRYHAVIPWIADATLPLWARSVASKERFRSGPAR